MTYYLLGHSAELLLKSFLCSRGKVYDEIKIGLGHDLVGVVATARLEGLPNTISTSAVEALSPAYVGKLLEYRQRKKIGVVAQQTFPLLTALPDLGMLKEEVDMICAFVFNCLEELD